LVNGISTEQLHLKPSVDIVVGIARHQAVRH